MKNFENIISDFKQWKKNNPRVDAYDSYDEDIIYFFLVYLYSRPYYDEDLQMIKNDIIQQENNIK